MSHNLVIARVLNPPAPEQEEVRQPLSNRLAGSNPAMSALFF